MPAFISYRHETPEHEGRVRGLAEALRDHGIQVVFDGFAEDELGPSGPPVGWLRWSLHQARDPSAHALIVASPGWFASYLGLGDSPEGRGSAAEACALLSRLADERFRGDRIRLVVLRRGDLVDCPAELKDLPRFECYHPSDVNHLAEWLRGAAARPPQMWPTEPGRLAWPIADHDLVRDATARLLTDAPTRYLALKGPSRSGKTTLTKVIRDHGQGAAWLHCGRLDFKGTMGLEAELDALRLHLDLAPAKASTLIGGLTRVIGDLTARPRPSLLLFDTFEAAGDAEAQWLEEILLPKLPALPQLRVIVAGSTVPRTLSARSICRHIDLTPPRVVDWFEYGRRNGKDDFDLAFVEKVHGLCDGRPEALVCIFGPASS